MSEMSVSSRSLTDRMIRAARLDVALYNEVEADLSATSQALTVVIISSVAAGIGGGDRWRHREAGRAPLSAV